MAVTFDLGAAPGHLIRRTQQLHSSLWNAQVGSELTSVQFAVLVLLAERPEIDQRTLGSTLSIDTSTLADVCARLAGRGLLDRERDEADARRYVLRVSAAGRELLDRTIPAVQEVGDGLLAPLEPAERQQLIALLRRILE